MPRPGERMSDEQRQRIAAALRGRHKDAQHRARIAASMRAWHQQRRRQADSDRDDDDR